MSNLFTVVFHRSAFLAAHIPLFLYPFLHTVSKTRPFEYLRLTSLGVIGKYPLYHFCDSIAMMPSLCLFFYLTLWCCHCLSNEMIQLLWQYSMCHVCFSITCSCLIGRCLGQNRWAGSDQLPVDDRNHSPVPSHNGVWQWAFQNGTYLLLSISLSLSVSLARCISLSHAVSLFRSALSL